MESVALRVVARVPRELRPGKSAARRGPRAAAARTAYFGARHKAQSTPVIARMDLVAARSGPLIVEEYDATCVVPPGWSAVLDAQGNLVLTADEKR